MKNVKSILLASCVLSACSAENAESGHQSAAASGEVCRTFDLADPMIGTDGIGHTFPGAVYPFGMVQLSPSNDYKGWNWSSGYHYSDTVLKGFAHTHFSGAGLSGLGDIFIMPMGDVGYLEPGTEENPETGYRSRFSHDNETAKPGYYSVLLEDDDVLAELTASPRVGFHRYTFSGDKGHVVIDPTHNIAETLFETHLEVVSDNVLRGYKHSDGEGGKRTVYFYAWFSQPFESAVLAEEDKPVEGASSLTAQRSKALLGFDVDADAPLEVRIALSHTSLENAELNFNAEAAATSFDMAHAAARAEWSDKLCRIETKGLEEDDEIVFSTALYHSFIHPTLHSDVNGDYWLAGEKRHSDVVQYTHWSTWDTFRALHPLYTIVDQEANTAFVNSLITRETEAGLGLPVWEAMGHDNVCMIGYNPASVVSDAVIKHPDGINGQDALASVLAAAALTDRHSPNYGENGIEEYSKLGFVPAEIASSVTKTTEYNYYDWTIAALADSVGAEEEAQKFTHRSLSYRELFDEETGYLLPRSDAGGLESLDMTRWEPLIGNYVSGNIWAYSLFLPHDIQGLIALHGGHEQFEAFLDQIIADESEIVGASHVDISGFIGKYGHGDEPSHHIPYLYAHTGAPWKTQALTRRVMNDFYSAEPDGLVNNEDLGQMSAWYVFSALGFYPVTPGLPIYTFGSPNVDQATIHLENGNTFEIQANNQSEENVYVQSVSLNGSPIDRPYIKHEEIMQGGKLVYEMGASPNKEWASSLDRLPPNGVPIDAEYVAPKVTLAPRSPSPRFFSGSTEVVLTSATPGAQIKYTLDGQDPLAEGAVYDGPIVLEDRASLRAVATLDGYAPSEELEGKFYKSILFAGGPQASIDVAVTPPSDYGYGLEDGSQLIDQTTGSIFFNDNTWTGFLEGGMDATIDLGEELQVSSVELNSLVDTRVWVFPPESVRVSISQDGESWSEVGATEVEVPSGHAKYIAPFSFEWSSRPVRYLRVEAKNPDALPRWHAGAGKTPFLFIDEIIVN